MLQIAKQSFRTGVVIEPAPDIGDAELEPLVIELRRRVSARFGDSFAVRQADAGSCNGCELRRFLSNPIPSRWSFPPPSASRRHSRSPAMLPPPLLEGERKSCAVWYVIFRQSPEIRAVNNPFIDQEQFEPHFVASPRHADALLCTGPLSCHMETALRGTWLTTPKSTAVIPSGDCACAGGELGVSDARCGRVEHVIPVDLCIPGCLLDAGRLDSRTGGGSGATGGRNRPKTQKGYQ